MTVNSLSFIDEMKDYVGFSSVDVTTLRTLASIIEPHLAALADRFYEEIPRHPGAAQVFKGGETQVARLKFTLQQWARGLFSGVYDEAYAQERFRIGFRHVQIGLPQRYVISAMYVVEQFIREIIEREIFDAEGRRQAHRSLSCVLNLDLNLICETYFEGSLRELRQLNDDLTAANRSLEEANRVKSEFLATVSHELRTPLTAIIGFSKLLADEAVREPEKRREFTRDIHGSALALLSLVDEILDLSRVESGRFQVRSETVDLVSEIHQALAAVAVEAERKHLSVDTQIPQTLPPVIGDSARVRQVLINLLGNAVKFTDHGSIRVRATLDAEGTRASVHIEDTGIGIAPEALPLLFEKFRQLDASHTRRHSGVGLGLAISKALIDRMGGSIELSSAGLGKGTMAVVTLPLATPEPRSMTAPVPLDQPVALLVGSDHSMRQRLVDAFEARGYMVRQGATVDDVRAMSKSERFAVFLLDTTGDAGRSMLAGWLDLLVELKSDGHSPRTDVIVLAEGPLDEPSRVQLEVVATSSAIVEKSTDPGELGRALNHVTARQPGGVMRVLVVDDDPLVFRFVSHILPSDRYALLHARGGHEGLRMAHTHPCDAILLDLRMPDGSGYDLIRQLKLRPNPSPVPIIVLTNYPEPADPEEGQLLHSRVVLEVVPKTTAARDPRVLVDRLEALRSDT